MGTCMGKSTRNVEPRLDRHPLARANSPSSEELHYYSDSSSSDTNIHLTNKDSTHLSLFRVFDTIEPPNDVSSTTSKRSKRNSRASTTFHELWKNLNIHGEFSIPYSNISFTIFQHTGSCHIDNSFLYNSDKTIPTNFCEEFYDYIQAEDENEISSFIICDGHNGSFAAQYITSRLLQLINSSLPTLNLENKEEISKIIENKYKELNHMLINEIENRRKEYDHSNHGYEKDAGINSGSTALTAFLNRECFYIANVGDTEAILCRNGIAEKLTQDHNVEKITEEEKENLKKKDYMIKENRIYHKNAFSLNLYRSFGDYFTFKGDDYFCKPYINQWGRANNYEFLLLTTDGVPSLSYNPQAIVNTIKADLLQKHSTKAALEHVCQTAIQKGSTDDITLILILFHNNEVTTTPPTQNKLSKTQLKSVDNKRIIVSSLERASLSTSAAKSCSLTNSVSLINQKMNNTNIQLKHKHHSTSSSSNNNNSQDELSDSSSTSSQTLQRNSMRTESVNATRSGSLSNHNLMSPDLSTTISNSNTDIIIDKNNPNTLIHTSSLNLVHIAPHSSSRSIKSVGSGSNLVSMNTTTNRHSCNFSALDHKSFSSSDYPNKNYPSLSYNNSLNRYSSSSYRLYASRPTNISKDRSYSVDYSNLLPYYTNTHLQNLNNHSPILDSDDSDNSSDSSESSDSTDSMDSTHDNGTHKRNKSHIYDISPSPPTVMGESVFSNSSRDSSSEYSLPFLHKKHHKKKIILKQTDPQLGNVNDPLL